MSNSNVATQKQNSLTAGKSSENTSGKPIINVSNLSKVFNPQIKAVNNISFQVNEGEIFGFLGPNGAGKTTTISMLTTLVTPTLGTAKVAGYDITKNASNVRKSIGVVQQDNTTDKHMTGYENLIFTRTTPRCPGTFGSKTGYGAS